MRSSGCDAYGKDNWTYTCGNDECCQSGSVDTRHHYTKCYNELLSRRPFTTIDYIWSLLGYYKADDVILIHEDADAEGTDDMMMM